MVMVMKLTVEGTAKGGGREFRGSVTKLRRREVMRAANLGDVEIC